MEQNRFLMDFIRMRKRLNDAPIQNSQPKQPHTKTSLIPTGHTEEKAVKQGDITYKYIVEKKPPKSDVVTYFRNRIEELKPDYEI